MKVFPLEPQSESDLQDLWAQMVVGLERGLKQPQDVKWLCLRGGLMGDICSITIPDELRQFSQLRVLEIEHHMAVHLSDVLAELPHLHTIILLGNEFRTAGMVFGKFLAQVGQLQALYLDCFSPLELTADLGDCASLRKLWIDECEVNGAEVIGKLENLEELSIDFDLSAQLPRLTKLKRLRLIRSECPPECISALPLTTLALHGIRQNTLPDWVGRMESLQELDLFQSDITELPDGFSALRGLCVSGSPLADKTEELQARFPGVEIID